MLTKTLSILVFLISTLNLSQASVQKCREEHYFVSFHDNLQPWGGQKAYDEHISWILEQKVEDFYEFKLFHGYSAKISAALKQQIEQRPEVAYVERVPEVSGSGINQNDLGLNSTNVFVSPIIFQNDSPWGLARITNSSRYNPLDTFKYPASSGRGVDIYILDSGVYIQHEQFGGRARFGVSFVPGEIESDAAGHGTFCAGLAAGITYGVAKNANIISVKVLNGQNVGSGSAIAQGIDWVVERFRETGRPSVANMSLAAPRSDTLNKFVERAIDAGVHVIVASGNKSVSACSLSPASSKAITVSSSDFFDFFSPFSNDGECVDIFAPGTAVSSCYIGSPSAIAVDSGTSQSAAFVSGTVALILAEKNMTPGEMKQFLIDTSVKDVLNAVPSGTPNRLLSLAKIFTDEANMDLTTNFKTILL